MNFGQPPRPPSRTLRRGEISKLQEFVPRFLMGDLRIRPALDSWRKILVPYRQVRLRRTFAWSRVFPAGALAIGGFGRSRWRLRRTRAGHIIVNGYSMAVSPFDRLRSGRTRIDKQLMGSTAGTIITQKPTVASEKIAARRTRDSVRRASDFVQIAITLTDPVPTRGRALSDQFKFRNIRGKKRSNISHRRLADQKRLYSRLNCVALS